MRAERDTSGLVHVYQIIIDKLTVADGLKEVVLVIFSGYLGQEMAPKRFFCI